MVEEPTGRRAVAVGPSREAAALAFGALFDDVLVTTYADLGADVDLSDVDTLALADGSGMEQVLESVLAADRPSKVLVDVGADPARRRRVSEVFEQNPTVGVVGTVRTGGGGSAVMLGDAGDAAVSGPAVATLLEAISTPVAPAPQWPAAEPEVPVVRDLPEQAPVAIRRPAPSTPASRRLGRRELVVLAAMFGAAVVAAVVLVVIGRSSLGADGVVVAMTIGLALVQVLTLAAVAYLIRSVRRRNAEDDRFRRQMTRRTDRLVKQGVTMRKRLRAQNKLPVMLRKGNQRAQRHHTYIVELGRHLSRGIQNLRNDGKLLHLTTQRQTQALLNLQELVRLEAAVPPAGGWAASPDLLLFCVDTVLAERPRLVVECGSGLSTLFLAVAAEQHELPTRIVALEHEERFAEATRALLERHGVADRVEVRLAPLQPSSVPDHETPWYAESALEGLADIGMLLVDGPPTATGPQARYPAVPLLQGRFAAQCTIVMDDLVRESDHDTAEAWARLLPDFEYSVIREYDKHVGLLRRG